MIGVKLFACGCLILFSFSCNDQNKGYDSSNQDERATDSLSTFNRIEKNKSLHISRYDSNYKPISFEQKRLIQIGDSIQVLGENATNFKKHSVAQLAKE